MIWWDKKGDWCVLFKETWKKMTNNAYKTNPKKINKTNCTFHLLRSGGHVRQPNSIWFVKYPFCVSFEWFQSHIKIYS